MTSIRVLLLGAAAAVLVASGAQAADLMAAPAPAPTVAPFNFDGFYAGVYAGAASAAGGWGTVGALVGTNFHVSDAVIGGVEAQAGGDWMSGTSSYDAELLVHLGMVLGDNVLLYGAAGVGLTDPVGAATQEGGWLVGGGLEVGVADNLAIRGEVLYGHAFSNDDSAAKATIGLIYHAN